MKKWFKKLFCQHKKLRLIEQVKRDGYILKKYQCEKCGKIDEMICITNVVNGYGKV